MTEISFPSMGSQIRIVLGAAVDPRVPDPEIALADAQAWTEDFAARLSRFRSDSELSALNADPRDVVPASRLLRSAVEAGLWAARATGGLVDPTLTDALEAVGYEHTRTDATPAPLAAALLAAPPRRRARPDPRERWRMVAVRDDAVARPPGLRLDTGGVGKGLAADALVIRLAGYERVAVDCGGDIRVGGTEAAAAPFPVTVESPLTGAVVEGLQLAGGAVATSGIDRNLWRRADGSFAHHLLDPATGTSAWTGLIGATALGPTALEAETLAKLAVLSGPGRARHVLARHGGIAFHDDGHLELVGRLRGLRRPEVPA